MRRDPLICSPSVGADTEFVDNVSTVRYEPRKQSTTRLDPSPQSRFNIVLNRPKLPLPDLDTILHSTVAFRGAHRRFNRDGFANTRCGYGAFQCYYAWFLIGLKSNLLSVVPRLLQCAHPIFHHCFSRPLVIDSYCPEAFFVVVVHHQTSLHSIFGLIIFTTHESIVGIPRDS